MDTADMDEVVAVTEVDVADSLLPMLHHLVAVDGRRDRFLSFFLSWSFGCITR